MTWMIWGYIQFRKPRYAKKDKDMQTIISRTIRFPWFSRTYDYYFLDMSDMSAINEYV